jgi:mRNA-degrading endonuclease RelE of RelBE toxin-antitoxin system
MGAPDVSQIIRYVPYWAPRNRKGSTYRISASGVVRLMRFVETPIFTRSIEELLDHEGYRSLQLALLLRPEAGRVVRGSGGLRNIRWSSRDRGKRGGCRVIYNWDEATETFYLLYAYGKTARDDLTAQQLRILSRLVREEFG